MTSATGATLDEQTFIWTAQFSPLYLGLDFPPFDYGKPYSTGASATFWAQGLGDPVVGMGQDSGSFDLINDPTPSGLLIDEPDPQASRAIFFAATLSTDWSDPGVDGCNTTNACNCLLLEDVDPAGHDGYFAIVGAQPDAAQETSFKLAGTDAAGHAAPVVLQPIPAPSVVGDPVAGATLDFTVTMPANYAGVYEAESGAGCACRPLGYQIYAQVVTPTGDWTSPADRDPAAWTLLPLAAGGGQGFTPIGQDVTVAVSCPNPTDRIFLASRLQFDSGFVGRFVSRNSAAFRCSPASVEDMEGNTVDTWVDKLPDKPTNPARPRQDARAGRTR